MLNVIRRAAEVVVFDHTCDDWRKCYKNSGIEDAAKAAKAKVVPANEESYYRKSIFRMEKIYVKPKFIMRFSIVMCG